MVVPRDPEQLAFLGLEHGGLEGYSKTAGSRVVQQRFALLWGRGACGVYKCINAKMGS